MTNNQRAPQAFKLEPEAKTKKAKSSNITFAVEVPNQEIATVPFAPSQPRQRGFGWGAIFGVSIATIFALWLGLAAAQTVEGLFTQSPFLGWLALGITGVAGMAAIAIIIGEILGLLRLRRIEHIQLSAAHAINQDDEASAARTVTNLKKLYAGRADSRWNLQNLETHAADIIDPRDRVRLAEHYLVDPFDEMAHRIIVKRAKRVTLLTTVTPAAALDVLFVAAQNLAMLRELASLYGGRPSTIATVRLARMIVTHLAVAGGLALSDNILQIIVGKGLLGRLSARFGEGVVNGILTARIGLAAIEVCRPIPQESTKRETLGRLLKELTSFGNSENP